MATTTIRGIIGPTVGYVPRTAIPIAATGTSFSFTFSGYGVISAVRLEVPNFTNDVTVSVSISDPRGVTVYSVGGLSKNAKYYLATDIDVMDDGDYTFTVTLSGDSGGSGGTVYVTLPVRPW